MGAVNMKFAHGKYEEAIKDCLEIIRKGGFIAGLGRYGQQPIRYVFDTDLADTYVFNTIHMYTTLKFQKFQNQLFWISTTK